MASDSAPGEWARAKLNRAAQLSHQIEASIQSWAADIPRRASAAIADDRLSFHVRMPELPTPPPVAEWTLLLGDSLHNLRSALDALVWSFADESALTPAQAQQIAFPVCADADRWPDIAATRLRTVPQIVADRIAAVQPMHGPARRNELSVLHDLDIQDKHRLSVLATVVPSSASLVSLVEFADAAAAERNTPPNITVHEPRLESGSVVFSQHTVDPIVSVRGDALSLAYRVALSPTEDAAPEGVLQLLRRLGEAVALVIEAVCADPRLGS